MSTGQKAIVIVWCLLTGFFAFSAADALAPYHQEWAAAVGWAAASMIAAALCFVVKRRA